MASCNPQEALWVAMDRDGAHKILTALNEPKDGDPRVQKTYSQSTVPSLFQLNQPGCTDITTLGTIHNHLK